MPLRVTRRAALSTALAMPFIRPAAAQSKRLVVRDTGVGTAFTDAFAAPFKAATGIEVVPVVAQHEPTGMIEQMVDAGSYTWDAAIVSRAAADQLTLDGKGYLDPLNLEDDAGFQALPEMFRAPHYAGNDVVATILAYRTDRVKTPPKSWADFWNVAAFPGERALRKFPFDTIEQALMADGVPPAKLFPLDFDRAFRSLDRIRPHISVWWTSGAQCSQMLQSGQVDYCPTWNGRAQVAIDAGAPVAIMWDQALWQSEGWVILKGTPNADLARQFVAFALRPDRQAAFAAATGFGPTRPEAIALLPPGKARIMPTYPANMASATVVDVRFWAKNKDAASDRFNQWVLG
jgi:putative spermidine/putrescine transport system substrate-binding protein